MEQLKALEERYSLSHRENAELKEQIQVLGQQQASTAEVTSARYASEVEKKDATITGLINGQEELKKVIATMEAEQLQLKAMAVDNGQGQLLEMQGQLLEMTNHIAQLTSHIQQRERQLQLSMKQTEDLKVELQKMHQNAQDRIYISPSFYNFFRQNKNDQINRGKPDL